MVAGRVLVAEIGAAHGLRGEVRLRSFTSDPFAVKDYGVLEADDGRTFEIESLRQGGNALIARFVGVSDRNAAESLRNVKLFISRAKLPATEAGEFYHADLIGLAVETADGERLGEVVAVHNFGAGDIIEVKPPSGHTFMLPFTESAVPVVDVAAGRLVVVPPDELTPSSPTLPHKGGGSALR
jgi:16S rRNA processing protein RimM